MNENIAFIINFNSFSTPPPQKKNKQTNSNDNNNKQISLEH